MTCTPSEVLKNTHTHVHTYTYIHIPPTDTQTHTQEDAVPAVEGEFAGCSLQHSAALYNRAGALQDTDSINNMLH